MLNIAVEAWMPASLPVAGIIALHAEACPERAVERVLRGIDDDACVPRPDNQVAGLGMQDMAKLFDPCVQIDRAHVLVGEAGLLVDRVDQMRAVRVDFSFVVRLQGRTQDGQAIVRVEQK